MKAILLTGIFCFLFGLTTAACSSAKTAGLEQNAEAVPSDSVKPVPSATSRLPKPPRDVWWSESSGNFGVQWTKTDITAANPKGREIFSARRFALGRLKTASKNELNFENYNFRYKILNLVGSILFLQETTSYSPQSYTNESYAAVDLANPAAKIALTKFYSEAEIIAALNKNSQIAEDLKINKLDAPKTFKEFFAAYDREPTEGTERKIDSCYFSKNFLESFYFERLDGDQIVVNLGIPCRVGMRDEEVFPMELLLPSKPAVESDLKSVNFRSRLEAVDNQAETVISFSAKSLKKSK